MSINLQRDLRLWLMLLAIICLASLGSFPIVENNVLDLTNGTCTVSGQSMHYFSTPQNTTTKSIPAEWRQTGRGVTDFENAQACAAAFVNAFQTYTASNPKTLVAGIYMLSSGAKQRFYGTLPQSHENPRMSQQRQAEIQKQRAKQVAQASLPSLLHALQIKDKTLLVWFVVPYQLSIQDASGSMLTKKAAFTVLVVSTPVRTIPQGQGTGWQVSDWRTTNTLFAPPSPL